MDVSQIFNHYGPRYFPYLVFACAVFENDISFIMAGIYASSLHPHLSPVLATLCGVAGAMMHDSFWYWIGRTNSGWLRRTSAWKKLGPQIQTWAERFGVKELFFCRFIPGTRNASILFWGISRLQVPLFYLIEAIGLLIWGSTLVFIGYKFGEKAQVFLGKVHERHLGRWLLLSLLVTALVYFSIRAFTRNEIVKRGRPPEDPRAD